MRLTPGLNRVLRRVGERIVEIDHPARPARRNGAKTDALDAVRAAREALTRPHLGEPRRGDDREALRVLNSTTEGAVHACTQATNAVHALVVTAPEATGDRQRELSTTMLLRRCANDINTDIGTLVASGTIRPMVQQAMDTVRNSGNESVHPGELNLNDDAELALALFGLVNLIADEAITQPRKVQDLYSRMPARKLDGVKQRDGAEVSES